MNLLNEAILFTDTVDGYLTTAFQGSDDANNIGLLFLNVFGSNRAHKVHVVSQNGGGPFGHIAEDLFLNFGIGSFEGEGEILGVHFSQYALNGAIVEVDDVLENEHEFANLFGNLGIFDFQTVEDGFFGSPITAVDDFRKGFAEVDLFFLDGDSDPPAVSNR